MRKITTADAPINQATTYLVNLFGHIEHGYVIMQSFKPADDENEKPHNVIETFNLQGSETLLRAAEHAVEMSGDGYDVYVCTTVMGVQGVRREQDATFTPALIADFDRDTSSKNKTDAWETLSEVEEYLGGLGIPATMLVESGNGWHGYWMLEEPLDWTGFDSDDLGSEFPKRMLTRFLGYLKSTSPHNLDSVGDGARLLRVPGTVNRKRGETNPVTLVVDEPVRRYSAQELDEQIPDHIVGTISYRNREHEIDQSHIEEWVKKSEDVTDQRGLEIIEEAKSRLRKSDDRHPSMVNAVAYLAQADHRRHINMGQALAVMSQAFDEVKPPEEQTHREFVSTVEWIIGNRAAEMMTAAQETRRVGEAILDQITKEFEVPGTEGLASAEDLAVIRVTGHAIELVDWNDVADGGQDVGWALPGIAPLGRMTTIQAQAGSGKSFLTYGMALDYAMGRDILSTAHPTGRPENVLYLDYEMTEFDLNQRTEAFGHDTRKMGIEVPTMKYALYPSIASLHTQEGASQLLAAVEEYEPSLLIVDTLSRAVTGGTENDDVPWREAFRLAWSQLKKRDITIIRLDHLGKDPKLGGRGSSSKRDEADVIWSVIQVTDEEFNLKLDKKRNQMPQEQITIKVTEEGDGLRLTTPTVNVSLTKAARETVKEMDRLGVPLDLGRPAIIKQFGITGKSVNINNAIKHRRAEAERSVIGALNADIRKTIATAKQARNDEGTALGNSDNENGGTAKGNSGEQGNKEPVEPLADKGNSEGTAEGNSGEQVTQPEGNSGGVFITHPCAQGDNENGDSELETTFKEALSEVAGMDEMGFGEDAG